MLSQKKSYSNPAYASSQWFETVGLPITAKRFSCVLGMLSSLEVKVLCPT